MRSHGQANSHQRQTRMGSMALRRNGRWETPHRILDASLLHSLHSRRKGIDHHDRQGGRSGSLRRVDNREGSRGIQRRGHTVFREREKSTESRGRRSFYYDAGGGWGERSVAIGRGAFSDVHPDVRAGWWQVDGSVPVRDGECKAERSDRVAAGRRRGNGQVVSQIPRTVFESVRGMRGEVRPDAPRRCGRVRSVEDGTKARRRRVHVLLQTSWRIPSVHRRRSESQTLHHRLLRRLGRSAGGLAGRPHPPPCRILREDKNVRPGHLHRRGDYRRHAIPHGGDAGCGARRGDARGVDIERGADECGGDCERGCHWGDCGDCVSGGERHAWDGIGA
mmetsp:Transcript_33980/g.62473  ORF Transcript_33980/g.62473 Transcript_33980/m.62473 type:complete len:335 (-) Transcript_33980:541-1545(-)